MSKQHRVMRNDLLETARNIFGDIVKAVYMDINLCQTIKGYKCIYINSQSNSIEVDAQTLIIEFINGKLVEFNSSEWASICRAKPLKVTNVSI